MPEPLPLRKGYWLLELSELLRSYVFSAIFVRNKDTKLQRCAIKNIER